MSGINSIAEGFYKKALNKEKKLRDSRMKVCESCKLLKEDKIFGLKCGKHIYLNPETDETSNTWKEGFYKGCGCILDAKLRVENSKCPLGKW